MNPKDIIKLDVPLFIRLLEYAREDAKTDMDLHQVADRIIELATTGKALTMDQYDAIMGQPVDEDKKDSDKYDLETEFLQKQIRARYPQAKNLSNAMALDYFKSQRQDRQDINRLGLENDQEQAEIDRLDQENDQEQIEIDRIKKIVQQLTGQE
jgi:hypothetical protein